MLQRTPTAGNSFKKPSSSIEAADPKGYGRARISNGNSMFAERVDYRSIWARRFRDLVALHVDELGGPESLSECQRSMIRRVVTLEVEMERLECKFAKEGGGSNRTLDRYMGMSNNLRRLFITLGLECKA